MSYTSIRDFSLYIKFYYYYYSIIIIIQILLYINNIINIINT